MSKELPFKLGDGVDTYNPDLASGELKFLRLKNINPFCGRLFTARGHLLVQTGPSSSEIVIGFASYTDPTTLLTNLYCMTQTKIYRYDFVTNQFNFASAIKSGMVNSELDYAACRWYSSAYITKPGEVLKKLVGATVTDVVGAHSARYMVVANSHLMMANTTESGSSFPLRFRWSDLYDPEGWTPGVGSEADFYELEPNEGEVTGLSYQRGTVVGYTRESIWVARYNPSTGTFNFDTLFSGVGCAAHYAQVRAKEVDFFLGTDNFYILDGLQIQSIGDPIWKFFKDTADAAQLYVKVKAFFNPSRHEVSWVYTHIDGYLWSVVYNYKENKWSDRDPQNVRCILNIDFALTGSLGIDQITTPIDEVSEQINGAWQNLAVDASNFYGTTAQRILRESTIKYGKFDGTSFQCEMETFEMDFNMLKDSKELDVLTLLFSRLGSADVSLFVGTRKSQLDSVSWSPAILLSQQLVNEPTFFFRQYGVGRFIRFKLTWSNADTSAILELYKLSFKYIANEDVET